MANLSPEEQSNLRKARQAALADPAVQAAKASGDQRAFHRALRETIERNNPELAPVFAKMRGGARGPGALGAGASAGRAQPGGGKNMQKRLAFLPEDERAKMASAYAAANSNPKLNVLREQWKSATTPEAKKQAGKAYREGVRDAMLRNDPSIAPILEKVREHRHAEAGTGAAL